MTDPREIAARLTEAQRDILSGHLVEIPPDEAQTLIDLDLKGEPYFIRETVSRKVWPITPLGLAVRAELEKEPQ